jgi:hypothetical protein
MDGLCFGVELHGELVATFERAEDASAFAALREASSQWFSGAYVALEISTRRLVAPPHKSQTLEVKGGVYGHGAAILDILASTDGT